MFNHLCEGTYIELGALDGVYLSNSYGSHKALEWRGVLIDLQKTNYDKLKVNRPNELATIHAGVCDRQQKLHWW